VTATQEIEPPAELVAELEEQIHQFHYRNPMEIRNLLNYPDEETVASVDALPSPGLNPFEGPTMCSYGKMGLEGRSQLPTLKRGRGAC